MTVSILLFAWYLSHRSPDTRRCRGFLSNLCGINGRAAVCLARSAVSLRGGVRTVARHPRRRRRRRLRRLPVNPARIERVRTELPSGYEVAALSGAGGARRVLGPGSRLDRRPAAVRGARRSCRRRGDDDGGGRLRAPGGSSTRWSPARRRRLDPSLIDECGQWTVSAGHTSGSVTCRGGARDRRRGDRRPVHRDHHRRRGRHRNPFARRTPSPPIWATTSRSSPSSAIRARRILHSDRISRRICW